LPGELSVLFGFGVVALLERPLFCRVGGHAFKPGKLASKFANFLLQAAYSGVCFAQLLRKHQAIMLRLFCCLAGCLCFLGGCGCYLAGGGCFGIGGLKLLPIGGEKFPELRSVLLYGSNVLRFGVLLRRTEDTCPFACLRLTAAFVAKRSLLVLKLLALASLGVPDEVVFGLELLAVGALGLPVSALVAFCHVFTLGVFNNALVKFVF
jgi:hypothetical protein